MFLGEIPQALTPIFQGKKEKENTKKGRERKSH
jgi:hypothetical protein